MMLLKPLAVAAAGLAATQAFLLVPGITEADADIIKALSFKPPKIAEKQTLELTCPGCPLQFENRDGKIKVKTDKASHLELSFAIDHQGESDRLLVNDFEIYPTADPFSQTLVAPHKPDHKKDHKDHKKDHKKHQDANDKHHNGHHKHKFISPQLGFSLLVNPITKDADQLELISIDLQIIEVGNNFVDGIPNVHIELIKTAEGNLMIGNLNTTPSQTVQSTPMDKQSECTTLLCKWVAIIDDKISKIKPFKHCGKGAGQAGSSSGRPHHHHHHGHSHHSKDGHKRSWAQLFKNIASHILLPVLIGIIAGISVSLIGMMVGTFIVALWRTFFRRPHHRQTGHSRRRSVHKESAVAEEKSGLMEHQDAPPSYEEEDLKKAEA